MLQWPHVCSTFWVPSHAASTHSLLLNGPTFKNSANTLTTREIIPKYRTKDAITQAIVCKFLPKLQIQENCPSDRSSFIRSRLSYEQFSAFLANVKELNSHKQTKEVYNGSLCVCVCVSRFSCHRCLICLYCVENSRRPYRKLMKYLALITRTCMLYLRDWSLAASIDRGIVRSL